MRNIHAEKINFSYVTSGSYSVVIFIFVIFMLVPRSTKKAPITFNTPVRFSARLIVDPAGRIFVKFGIADLQENS